MSTMRVEMAARTHRGGREANEDSVRCLAQGDACVAVVADGLGGHGGGAAASRIVADRIAEGYMAMPTLERDAIGRLCDEANRAVVAARTPPSRMKSTGVALFVCGTAAAWAHVGDSRLYHMRNGEIVWQTIDHSASQMAVFSREITREQIRHHPDRNRLLRAFGDDEGVRPDIANAISLAPGSHAFLLCSDGFWEYVWELEMQIEIAKARTAGEWLEGMIGRLARRVPRDHDNFSAVAVFIDVVDGGVVREG